MSGIVIAIIISIIVLIALGVGLYFAISGANIDPGAAPGQPGGSQGGSHWGNLPTTWSRPDGTLLDEDHPYNPVGHIDSPEDTGDIESAESEQPAKVNAKKPPPKVPKRIIPDCPPGFYSSSAGLCRESCPAGYELKGEICYRQCPYGWAGGSTMAHCQKHRIPSIGVSQVFTCDNGMTLAGGGRCRGKITKLTCEPGKKAISGLCYNDCPEGYERVPGDIGACLLKCPSDFKDIGVGGCTKPIFKPKLKSTAEVGVCPPGYKKEGGLCIEIL